MLSGPNKSTSPYNWTSATSGTVRLMESLYTTEIRLTLEVVNLTFGTEFAYYLRNQIDSVLNASNGWANHDAYYMILRNGVDGTPRMVYKILQKILIQLHH